MGLFKRKKKVEEPESPLKPVIEEPPKENDPEKFLFSEQSLPEEYRDGSIYVYEWKVSTGDLVKKGEPLAEFRSKEHYNITLNIDADCDGVIEVHKHITYNKYSLDVDFLKEGETTHTIYRNPTPGKIKDTQFKRFFNIVDVKTDDFKGTKEITWKSVGGKEYGVDQKDCVSLYNEKFLFFTLNNIENKDYIIFRFEPKEYKLVVGSKISFLFDGHKIHTFTITQKPYKSIDKSQETKLQLSIDELDTMVNYNLLKWQVELPDGMKLSGETEDNKQYIVKTFTKDYRSVVEREITEYEPLMERVEEAESNDQNGEACYVYLMIDTTNNYYKIGISNHPDYREKTLQSEKPTIEMVSNKRFPNRKIAASFEQALHQAYSEKRVRGEWFSLDESDVSDIIESLK